jgi:spore coat polysaccharide biosynthesis protein SpsF
VAIPDEKSDDRLAEYLDSIDQTYVRGSHLDVLERFLKVEKIFKPKTIIRVTADCPLVMPELIDDFIEIFHKKDVEYLSNVLTPTFPDGLDIEIFKAGVLTKLNYFDLSEFEREHVTLGLIKRKQMFSTFNVELNTNLSNYRWTIDTKSDFEFLEKIFNVFNSKEITLNFKELLYFL